MLDSNGNDYLATLYESYLSKTIIEHSPLYEALFLDITKKIVSLITATPSLDRNVFSFFTYIQTEFPEIKDVDCLLKRPVNIYAMVSFHKFFFELAMPHIKIKPLSYTPNRNSFLRHHAQASIANNKQLLTQLQEQLRPENIYLDQKTGREEDAIESPKATRKFGITHEEMTPPALSNYFSVSYFPGQNKYNRDYSSDASKWHAKKRLPLVSGVSSTIGTCYTGLLQIDFFKYEDVKTYLMVTTACLVARGHHSFGETQKVLELIGFFPEQKFKNMHEYYRQFLTREFVATEAYKKLLTTIDSIPKDSNTNLNYAC